MKVSEIKIDNVKEYLKIDSNEENMMLETILTAAKSFVKGYTGLTDEQIDIKEDITLAILVICNELDSNRELTVSEDKLNPIVKSILDMHSINYL